MSEYEFENGTPFKDAIISVAAEPHWVEVSREELRRRQYALSALLGRLKSKSNSQPSVLTADEEALLEAVWEMHKELLK